MSRTTRWKLSFIFLGVRGRSEGVAGILDVLVGSDPSSLCFLKASTHGVLTRMLVKSLYTPSVLQAVVAWKLRSAGVGEEALQKTGRHRMARIVPYQKIR